ncbi:MAG TPA: hypothetical protein VFT71_03850, partial [Candidatus Nitrosocosmicus sp.]|nr:hypothetical protein [Candidatus Nitrosocosmicus sp.]
MNRNLIIIFTLSLPFLLFSFCNIYAQSQNEPIVSDGDGGEGIVLSDPKLKLELVASGLDFPTTMAFLGPNDFLILEKDTGLVKRVINGKTIETPLLQIEVSKKDERGLLGVAVSERKTPNPIDDSLVNNNDITHNVFLYAVQCEGKGKTQNCENRIYRYDLDNKNNLLINPKMLLAIPSFPD